MLLRSVSVEKQSLQNRGLLKILKNNILNQRETHRIVIEIAPQTWKMGKPKLKL